MNVRWEDLFEELKDCQKCRLCRGRTNVVPGEGNPRARLMIVGEGPGRDEDRLGRPFVGAAGQLLEKMLAAIGEDRNSVYIANVVKCRPPENRTPQMDEMQACLPYLRMQTALIRPQVILLMGSMALRAILGEEMRITQMRGQWVEKKGVWMMPTFHPAALLRDESKKRPVWEDLKKVREKLVELSE